MIDIEKILKEYLALDERSQRIIKEYYFKNTNDKKSNYRNVKIIDKSTNLKQFFKIGTFDFNCKSINLLYIKIFFKRYLTCLRY